MYHDYFAFPAEYFVSPGLMIAFLEGEWDLVYCVLFDSLFAMLFAYLFNLPS